MGVTCCHHLQAGVDLGCHISVTPAEAGAATLHGCLALHLPTAVHRPTACYDPLFGCIWHYTGAEDSGKVFHGEKFLLTHSRLKFLDSLTD